MDLLEQIDSYVEYPRDEAYNRYLDERNLRVFKTILVVLSGLYLLMAVINIADNEYLNFSFVLILISSVFLFTLRFFYKKLFNVGNIRRSIFIILLIQLLLSIAAHVTWPEEEDVKDKVTQENKGRSDAKTQGREENDFNITVGQQENSSFIQYFLFFGIIALIFRFSRTEIVQLFIAGMAIPLIAMAIFNTSFDFGNTIPNMILGFMFFTIAFITERKRQKKFYEQYDFSYRKNYENLRMKKELNYAREIQLSMLPENNAVIGGIQVSAVSIPASEVGGDYFDYFTISENETGFFICDVSGHGVASGLMLSGLRSSMHTILEDNNNPRFVLEKLNRMIRKTQSRKMFVTAILAVINTETDKCMLYNAGHLPPYKISGESKEIFKIKKHGIALGAMSYVDKSGSENEVVFDFKKGDKLIFYTDGVNEAMNSGKAEYGLDNLELFLNSNADKETGSLLKGLIDDVKRFTGNSIQRDDLTLLIIQRT